MTMDLSHIRKEIDEILEKSKKYMCLDDAKALFYLTSAVKNLECEPIITMSKNAITQTKNAFLQTLDRETAIKWVSEMQNADGSSGGHWNIETTNRLRIREGLSDIPEYEFYAIMNMLYSDYCVVADKYNLIGNLDFWLDMAKAWYYDEDSNEGKTSLYEKYIVKK